MAASPKPVTQLDINTWVWFSRAHKYAVALTNFCWLHFSTVWTCQSGLVAQLPFFKLLTLSLFRNTCRHRALNPLSVPRCVRSAVERRCWRISRNAILQGGNRGAIWGQRGGNVWTVEHFTFLEPESEDSCPCWERGRAEEEWRNDGESDGRRPVTLLRSHWRT